MAVATINAALATTATANTVISGSVDCTGANCLVTTFSWSATSPDAAPTAVTYNSVAMTLVYNQVTAGGANGRTAMYYLVNPTTGSNTLSVTFAVNQDELQLVGQALTGVNTGSPVGTPTNTNGLTTDPTINVTGASGDLIVDGVYIIDTGTASPTLAVGSGQTQIANITASATVVRHGCSTEPGAASVTMNWTTNGVHDQWAQGGVAFKATTSVLYKSYQRFPNKGRSPKTYGARTIGFKQGIVSTILQTFSYTGVGGLIFSGTGAELRVAAPSPSGGLVFSGTGSRSYLRSEPSPTGGLLFGGTGAEIRVRAPGTPTGGLIFGGAVIPLRVHSITGAGGLTFAGTGGELRLRTLIASGGYVFGGSAPVSYFTVGQVTNQYGYRRYFTFHSGRR